MKPGYSLFLSVAILVSISLLARGADSPPHEPPLEPSQTWVINYPESKPYGRRSLYFSLGWSGKSQGLRLDISGLPEKMHDGDVSALLHLPNQEAIRPSWADLIPDGKVGSFGGSTPGAIAIFPWSSNAMEIGWIEVTVIKHRFWLKVPYGFTRNPFEQTLPPISTDVSSVPGWVRNLSKNDEILDWRSVTYEFPIQNGRQLSLIQTNRSNCALALGRNDVHSPVTSLKIAYPGKEAQDCRCTSISLLKNGGEIQGSDVYYVPLNRHSDRCLETVEIGVDEKVYKLTVPSSLYQTE